MHCRLMGLVVQSADGLTDGFDASIRKYFLHYLDGAHVFFWVGRREYIPCISSLSKLYHEVTQDNLPLLHYN